MNRFARALQTSILYVPLVAGTLAFAQPPGRGARGDGPPRDREGQRREQEGDREQRDAPAGEERGFRGPGPGGPGGPGPRGPFGGFEGRREGGPPPEIMMRMSPVLDALDADDDGEISESEIADATATLKKIDKNGDGKLAGEELRPDFPGRGGPPFGPGGGRGFGPPEGRGPDGRGPGGPPGDRGPSDREQTSRVSTEQVNAALRGIVMRADADGDGYVTGDEMIALLRRGVDRDQPDAANRGDGDRPQRGRPDAEGRGGPPGRPGFGGPPDGDPRQFFTRMFQMRDQNQDGKLTGDEIPEQMSGRLEQIDQDGDGAVSKEEMEQMMGRMRGGFGPPGRGGNRGPGEGGGRPGGDLPRRPETEEEGK